MMEPKVWVRHQYMQTSNWLRNWQGNWLRQSWSGNLVLYTLLAWTGKRTLRTGFIDVITYLCSFICIFIYVCIYVSVFLYTYVCLCVIYIHIFICGHIYVYIFSLWFVFDMYCLCMYIFICNFTIYLYMRRYFHVLDILF